jgi:predicted ester cyclase
MSVTENKDLVRRYYEEVVGTGDVERLPDFVSPSYEEVHDNARYPMGLEGAREHVLGVRSTYPDLRLTVEQQVAEGEWVVSRVTARGTHEGEWLGMRPTGQVLEMTAVNVDRVVDGRIVEHGGAANLLIPLLAAGAVRIAHPVEAGGDREYHHLGIPTTEVREGEEYLEAYGMHVSGYDRSEFGIEWMRFDADSPLPDLVKSVPHVAFRVDDLEESIAGRDVLIQPNSPSPGVRVAFIVENGAPVELLEVAD